MKNTFLLLCFVFLSCDNNNELNTSIIGKWDWTIQNLDAPPFSITPQTTGVQETLTFNADGTYSVTTNNKITNSGTYKKFTAKNLEGKNVTGISYSNTRVTDSTDYYTIVAKSNTLIFSKGIIGLIGSGSREYIRK